MQPTPITRLTYAAWLDEIGQTGRTDPAGLIAAGWLAAKANGRPRYSAPKSVNAWLAGDGRHPAVENPNAVLHALVTAYNAQEPPLTAALPPGTIHPATAAQDAANAAWQGTQPPEQQPGQWTGGGQADAWQQPELGYQPQGTTPLSPGEQLILQRLDEITAAIAYLAPLAELVAGTMAEEGQSAVNQAASIAEQAGVDLSPGRPDFYGGHVVQPDFAQMATDSDGSEQE